MSAYLVLAALTAALIYLLLYRQGLAATKRITSILFLFRAGKHRDSATLVSCTGWVRHVGRFRKNQIYAFYFDCQLSKGLAEVVLLDGQKRELLRLNRHKTAGQIELRKDCRYYLQWELQSATGKCELRW